MGFSPIGVICTRMYVIVCASSSHVVVFDENFDHGLFYFISFSSLLSRLCFVTFMMYNMML